MVERVKRGQVFQANGFQVRALLGIRIDGGFCCALHCCCSALLLVVVVARLVFPRISLSDDDYLDDDASLCTDVNVGWIYLYCIPKTI